VNVEVKLTSSGAVKEVYSRFNPATAKKQFTIQISDVHRA